jgi:hypothetical protein
MPGYADVNDKEKANQAMMIPNPMPEPGDEAVHFS